MVEFTIPEWLSRKKNMGPHLRGVVVKFSSQAIFFDSGAATAWIPISQIHCPNCGETEMSIEGNGSLLCGKCGHLESNDNGGDGDV
jgi:ribosomal protein S27AE